MRSRTQQNGLILFQIVKGTKGKILRSLFSGKISQIYYTKINYDDAVLNGAPFSLDIFLDGRKNVDGCKSDDVLRR